MSKSKAALLVVALAILFVFGLFVGRILPRIQPKPIYNTSSVIRQIQTLSQLVTVKYVIEKVVVLEDVNKYIGKNMLGESRVILIAHGIVKAGVDLEKLQPGDIEISEKKIKITLPSSIITDSYLDEHQTQILERTTGIMRTFDKDLEQNARRQAIGEIASAARKQKIIEEADERARTQLKNLFQQLGFEEVDVQTK